MRRFLILFPGTLAVIALAAMALPMGEVVRLHTVDADGRDHESALWLVEVAGVLHLRSGDPEASWFERLRSQPRVQLERADSVRPYRAVASSDADLRRAVNDAMARKYGLTDRLLQRALDFEHSIPVRLEPIESPDAADLH